MNQNLSYYDAFITHLKTSVERKEPLNLYDPMHYILHLGGKRLRPILTLMAADLFGGDYNDAMDAALCVEVFHNFSLVHDDIMDDAPLRRGKETVHKKWDTNTAILSGDAMLIKAYSFLESYDSVKFVALVKLLTKTSLEVCEGQQYDVDFETRDDVTIPEYLKMIEFKTAVLVGAAMQMGAIVANASLESQQAIYDFGRYLGIAFQLQDDYLDAFGDPERFGKQIGGDIIENKKTYLYLKALEFSDDTNRLQLGHLYTISPTDPTDKIQAVKQIFLSSGSAEATKEAIEVFTSKAFDVLESIDISDENKAILRNFGQELMNRNV
ncbi:polyprenyl synthetase family protein [Psychroserpens sp.]|uniref:polyprenyl synthetase family protein n=1 Tax=Psychroserpens sp. TaxID=2020870 RepID=UPI001B19BEEC|nr:polyprenyl synthetase family protein [Psychroserpens sp.]MBO6607776.1 polyprenyl synthetase family protein [Psychroserpens sp.]MBO6630328.1 polyprenyl synthetase family protein [Psychroserpens sp.]MBO6654767.1 polyprenyl synthetase family protein [Psychroserpens sp.]MBO6682809.1 polyprenyl synthetase family protein [Psychroserpens sp.]MBO6751134.1 polyprenyl synthetase family protein [Psychroserpens sp.]